MAELTDGKIVPVVLEEEMRQSFLAYAMSVIVDRALPDVRDGLKPVHRRILYGMYESGTTPDKPYKKSARIVGDVMGRYHPHGDAAIYDTMVRMAQDFSFRHMLVDGHGNFGSVDGDPPAAMRYTEVRLAKLAMEMLSDIDKKTVDFKPNFDESLQEPVVLPSRFPNLLVNGSAGIAVGMATNILPHNLGEVIDGAVLLIDEPDADDKDLLRLIKGPDFPTGGIILGRSGIRNSYATGRGSIKVRARTTIEEMNNGKHRILVSELPYQVNKARLVEQIASLVREKTIDGITDLRDESDRTGMRVVIELRRDVNPNIVLNQLYKHTPLQQSFGVIMLVLVNNEPKILSLRQILEYYLEHQREVVTRRTQYDLAKAEDRAHILEGLRIALDHIDAVINLIRSSRTVDIAREGLMTTFGLSEKQAQAILEMRLQRLTGLERDKIEAEYADLLKMIAYYKELLADVHKLMQVVKEELLAIKDKFSNPRRTEIAIDEEEDFVIEDLIAEEDIVVTMTRLGYIKRLPVNTYRSQRRGGRGSAGISTKEEDFVEQLFISTTHEHILFFTNRGRVYHLKAYEIPESGRQARGTAIVNLLQLEPGERVNAIIPIREFVPNCFLFMGTRNGVVKKTSLEEFDSIRKGGLIAIHLDDDDELIDVKLTDGNQEIIMVTERGQAIRFPETEARSLGRTARGVKGITLGDDDRVVGMETIKDHAELLVITAAGIGKRTDLDEYRVQSRGGKGIKVMKLLTAKHGTVVGIKIVQATDELMVITAEGIIIRTRVDNISLTGRDTQGVRIMKLDPDDRVVALARVVSDDDKEETDSETDAEPETEA
ncbi:DNA gyrase subunit A [Hydrogenispora ethanolica]|jgi:DNA gyrase subunit A|uniref:DNA gyrase subunit A n=1 Tax=Hydrogenispora ethanolica TaxID=1082276 RepID=A0A4R1RVU0_HYDET|nr:DNA gyrase subunit A [Hydrogenispora ethanolica]TCL70062.1 DNA gyrase subunit A [Hydrogenispora ethanolica]